VLPGARTPGWPREKLGTPRMRPFLTPVVAVDPRPADSETARYVCSFLLLRVMVGALGIARRRR